MSNYFFFLLILVYWRRWQVNQKCVICLQNQTDEFLYIACIFSLWNRNYGEKFEKYTSTFCFSFKIYKWIKSVDFSIQYNKSSRYGFLILFCLHWRPDTIGNGGNLLIFWQPSIGLYFFLLHCKSLYWLKICLIAICISMWYKLWFPFLSMCSKLKSRLYYESHCPLWSDCTTTLTKLW